MAGKLEKGTLGENSPREAEMRLRGSEKSRGAAEDGPGERAKKGGKIGF